MTVDEQLKDFLKSGQLKNISYGQTRSQLTKILGSTDWKFFSSSQDKYPSIYKFGRFEFYFEQSGRSSRLSGIVFQPIPSPADNGLLKFKYNGWTKRLEIGEAIEFLKINKIKFKEELSRADQDFKLLITEGKVSIFFDSQSRSGNYLLQKIGRFVDNL